jgi:hypothetical protein
MDRTKMGRWGLRGAEFLGLVAVLLATAWQVVFTDWFDETAVEYQ